MAISKKASLKNKLKTVKAKCQCGNCSNTYEIFTLLSDNEYTFLKKDIENGSFYNNFYLDNYINMESSSDGIHNTISKYQKK